jgi:hypothetical protein
VKKKETPQEYGDRMARWGFDQGWNEALEEAIAIVESDYTETQAVLMLRELMNQERAA